jgi:hypothetical protein
MPSYFTVTGATPQITAVCDSALDTAFLLEIVSDFKKILGYMPFGTFPVTVRASIQFETDATVTETIVLDLAGTVILLYSQLFNEPYPEMPFTDLQRERINAIWVGVGHPENIIPT